ncbi:Uncharacterized protein HZ326_9079 [Fusarium oxysporum f. sp. albedinis]|nr:Uncharacterized protein HZ326_9079 [Fusarium oxysporum f. sp. albedinis]
MNGHPRILSFLFTYRIMASTKIRANSVTKSPLWDESIRAVLRRVSSCYFPSRSSLGFEKASVIFLFKGAALRISREIVVPYFEKTINP